MRARWAHIWLLALIGVVLLLPAGPLTAQAPAQEGQQTLTTAPDGPHSVETTGATPLFGTQVLVEMTPAEVGLLRTLGPTWAPVYIAWAQIEPTNRDVASYEWSETDQRLAGLVAAGVRPILQIESPPSWAKTAQGRMVRPENLGDFEEFVRAVVIRYSRSPWFTRYYMAFVEPDSWPAEEGATGGGWGGHGAEYAAMMRVFHRAVHAGDGEAKTVLGSLAHETWNGCDPSPCFDMNFLPDVVAAGGAPYIDVVSFNYYDAFGFRYWPRNVLGKALTIRGYLPADQRTKPLMIAEIGEPFRSPDTDEAQMRERQSAFVVKAYAHTMGGAVAGLNFEAVNWFSYDHFEASPTLAFGLLNQSEQPLPSYTSYRYMARRMRGAQAASMLSLTGGEGYLFVERDGGGTVIAWSTGGAAPTITLRGPRVNVTNKYGVGRTVIDGGPGDLDGAANRIGIQLTTDPVYLRTLVECGYDADADMVITIVDMMTGAKIWNRRQGEPGFNPDFDFNHNGLIDASDLQSLSTRWRTGCVALPSPFP